MRMDQRTGKPLSGDAPCRGVLRRMEPLSRHTSWRVGGAAERFYQPQDCDDLANFLAQLAPDEPLFWLGLGSNLLVRDGGIRGTVICTCGMLGRITQPAADRLRVEAGVPCAKVARRSVAAGLSGAEFLAGIPGTMGGALAMNAGAFGGETWELVQAVETIDRCGRRQWREATDFSIAYRKVHAPAGEWFLTVELRLQSGDGVAGAARVRDLLNQRSMSQPTGVPSGGSVFRNPPGDFAGRLIEASGLKGRRVGGASVAKKHANFIVNDGQATAADIESLIRQVITLVEQRQGVILEPEVHIVGEPASGNSDD